MQEEVKQEYDKIKDKLTEEEFMQEIENIKANSSDEEFINDYGAAQIVVQNYADSSDELAPEIKEQYEKVSSLISQDDFIKRMNEYKVKEEENPFMDDLGIAKMVVGEYLTEEVETISEQPEFAEKTISQLEDKSRDVVIEGRVTSVSNPRSFKTRKGVEGQVCNVQLKDNTGEVRAVFWTPNIKLLKNVNEGDLIQIKNVDIKEGYSGLEANLRPRSTVIHIDDNPEKFPPYNENLVKIEDIQADTKVNFIAKSNLNYAKTFKDLNNLIVNADNNAVIELNDNYIYNDSLDSSYKSGISITKNLTINGNNKVINAYRISRLFNINTNVTLKLNNIIFTCLIFFFHCMS